MRTYIKLHKFADRERFITYLWKKQNGRCLYCCIELDEDHMHIDHILAVARWGDNHRDNLALACAPCNMSKQDKPAVDLVARMLTHQQRETLKDYTRSSFSIYLQPALYALVRQFKRDHPEIALSCVLSNFLAQYLHDQGYTEVSP